MTNTTNQQSAKYAEIIAWCTTQEAIHTIRKPRFTAPLKWMRQAALYIPQIAATVANGHPFDMKNTALQAAILRRASEIRTNFANKIAQELGDGDMLNTAQQKA